MPFAPLARRDKAITKPVLIFDLDGTLVDSAPDICAATNHALASFAVRELTPEEIGLMIGNGLSKLLERAFEAVEVVPTTMQFEQALSRLVAYYEEHPATFSRLYPGTEQALAQLAERGFSMAVCTNKQETIAVKVLAQFQIAHFFKSIIGGVPGRPKKPDPAPFIEAVKKAGGKASHSILIGDSEADAALAQAVGCPLVLVPHGYCLVPLSILGAVKIVDTMADLPEAIGAVVLKLEAMA